MASFRSDISYSELMYYREHEKLSNKEIAQRLGVSRQMVVNIIGKEPKKTKGAQDETGSLISLKEDKHA